jgi:hypothetical protein
MHTDSNLRRGLLQIHSGAHSTWPLSWIGSPKLRGSFQNGGKMETSASPTPSFTTSYKSVAQFRESLLTVDSLLQLSDQQSVSHGDDIRGFRRHYGVCKGRSTPMVIFFIQGEVYVEYISSPQVGHSVNLARCFSFSFMAFLCWFVLTFDILCSWDRWTNWCFQISSVCVCLYLCRL